MFAIIETGGKQYKVNEGDVIFVEKLECAEGEKVVFDKVLAVGADDCLTAVISVLVFLCCFPNFTSFHFSRSFLVSRL